MKVAASFVAPAAAHPWRHQPQPPRRCAPPLLPLPSAQLPASCGVLLPLTPPLVTSSARWLLPAALVHRLQGSAACRSRKCLSPDICVALSAHILGCKTSFERRKLTSFWHITSCEKRQQAPIAAQITFWFADTPQAAAQQACAQRWRAAASLAREGNAPAAKTRAEPVGIRVVVSLCVVCFPFQFLT